VFEIVDSQLRMVLTSGVQRALRESAAIAFKGVKLDEVRSR